MGSWTSRQNNGVEEVDVVSNHAYKYPPRSGNYFGSHFIMGGERFDTPQPEAYLFGENSDLNFLGSRPTPFPYPPPQANEPTKTLKSLVNIRKESLRFVRAPADCVKISNAGDRDIEAAKGMSFNIEFTFDCDVRCAITIYYFSTEDVTLNGIQYTSKDPSKNSDTFHYKRGANQQFCQPLHVFDPTRYSDDELLYNPDKEVIPIAIHCVAEEGVEDPRQSHTTIAVVEKHTDGSYVLKALKQKLFVDGLCYLLQEIYGIENKNNDSKNACDEETEDNGSECVICMCDVRDTLILPCRHLCLCNSCADSLRYQANNCPICRAPFRALLQIRALQKCVNIIPAPTNIPEGSCENIPAGYEAVSLIEALNGPCIPRSLPNAPTDLVETPETESSIQAAEILNRSNLDRSSSGKSSPKENDSGKSTREKSMGSSQTPEFRMSVLLQREEDSKETPQSPLLASQKSQTPNSRTVGSQIGSNRSNKCTRPRDSLRLINEKIATENNEMPDDDSEGEKMSPLLDKSNNQTSSKSHKDAVIEPIDDTDTDQDDPLAVQSQDKPSSTASAITSPTSQDHQTDDSDCYTPDDIVPVVSEKDTARPHTAPAAIHIKENVGTKKVSVAVGNDCSSSESTPLRHPLGASLPGTPSSRVSIRSSGDSLSSASSTKQLLKVVATNESGNNESSIQV